MFFTNFCTKKVIKLTFLLVLINKFHHFHFWICRFGLLNYAFSKLYLVLLNICKAVKQHPNDLVKNH